MLTEAFISEHGAELARLIRNALARAGARASHQDVEDLQQDLYLRLLPHDTIAFATRNVFWAYMHRAIRGITIDFIRHHGARKRGAGAAHVPIDDAPHLLAADPPADRRLEAREAWARTRRRITTDLKPTAARRVLRLLSSTAVEGRTVAEAATDAGFPTSAAAAHALLRLRRSLRPQPPAQTATPP